MKKKEPTRIREGGTAVMNASTAADMLAAFRAIVPNTRSVRSVTARDSPKSKTLD
jgi:hypothetical protein